MVNEKLRHRDYKIMRKGTARALSPRVSKHLDVSVLLFRPCHILMEANCCASGKKIKLI